MKALMIVNPIAGRGVGPKRCQRLKQALEQAGWRVDLHRTGQSGDAHRLAAELPGSPDRLIVVGGDGTLNEVINGLTEPSRLPIALIPTGTGNVLARDLGLPRGLKGQLRMLQGGAVRWLDMGLATAPASGQVGGAASPGRRFLALLSSGLDAMVVRRVHQKRGRRLGRSGYFLPILRTLWTYRAPRLQLSVDGQVVPEGSMLVIGNTRHYAGLLDLMPKGRFDSGRMQACLMRRGGWADLLGYALAALLGRLPRLRSVHRTSGRCFELRAEPPTPVEADGDDIGDTPVSVRVQPAMVPLLVPGRIAPNGARRPPDACGPAGAVSPFRFFLTS
jgi:YegS/Rv2252/BmrU family lipid kinase